MHSRFNREEKTEQDIQKENRHWQYVKDQATRAVMFAQWRERLFKFSDMIKKMVLVVFIPPLLLGLNYFLVQKSEIYLCQRPFAAQNKEIIRFSAQFWAITGKCLIQTYQSGQFMGTIEKSQNYCEERLISYSKNGHCRQK